jgi:hypothetical protein
MAMVLMCLDRNWALVEYGNERGFGQYAAAYADINAKTLTQQFE